MTKNIISIVQISAPLDFIDNKQIFHEREKLLNHILYEMQMFLLTKDYLYNYYHDQITFNILWTSCLTHMRTLIYFFCEVGMKDDILCSEIISNTDGLIIPKEDEYKYKTPINKSVSHLTNERRNKEFNHGLNKSVEDIMPKIVEMISLFIDRLQPDQMKDYKCNSKDKSTVDLKEELKDKNVKSLIRNVNHLLKSHIIT